VIYDAAGKRVAERAGGTTRGFIGPDQVRTVAGGIDESRLEISAFGERVAYTVFAAPRIAAPLHALELEVPSWVLSLPCAVALSWCLALAIRGGLLAGVARRPACAGLAGLLIAAVAIPSPAFAGGGGWSGQLSTRWVLSDALGSGLAVLDETGLLLHQTRFEPFGAVDDGEYHAAPDPSLRRYFAGHPEQAETGLHYMNARWLDPQTGVFLGVDPLVASPDDPQSYNAYAYARNNPIALADPTGALFDSPLAELQNCDRCSGFAFVPGFYMGADGSGGWLTSQSQFHQVEGEFTEARAAAGWVDPGSGPSHAGSGVDAASASAEAIGQGAVLGALGDAASTAGSALARVAEIMAWDFALAVVGILGNVFGIAAGLAMAIEGFALMNPTMVAVGLMGSFWALVPRYGFWSGPYWGQPNLDAFGKWFGPFSSQNVIESATYQHDQDARKAGADRALIRDVWSRNDLGPAGQIYRVGLTAAFETRIAFGMDD
jgi:RHS repeat-associated protein